MYDSLSLSSKCSQGTKGASDHSMYVEVLGLLYEANTLCTSSIQTGDTDKMKLVTSRMSDLGMKFFRVPQVRVVEQQSCSCNIITILDFCTKQADRYLF